MTKCPGERERRLLGPKENVSKFKIGSFIMALCNCSKTSRTLTINCGYSLPFLGKKLRLDHCRVVVSKCFSSTPLEIKSAGLESVGTYRHAKGEVGSSISLTRLPTNVFNFVISPLIQPRTA